MQNFTDTNSTTFSSWIVSALIHALIVGGIFFIAQTKPLPEVELMEASLATGSDLSGMKAQIASMYAKNQAAQKQATTSQEVTSQAVVSEELQSYNDDLAQRQQEYEAQMQAYAKALDEEIASEMYAQKQAQKAEDEERQRQVNELKSNERSNSEIAQQNSKELSKSKESQKQTTSQSSQAHDDDGTDDTPKTPTVGQGGVAKGGNGSGTGGSSKNEIISALQAHIKKYWTPTGSNQTLQVSLQVDGQGDVLSVQVSGGTDALRSALEDTIRRASPLTPIEGTSYRNLSFNFRIN